MSPRFMIPLAVAAGAGVLFSLGIMFGLGLLAPPEKIEANGPSRYVQRTQDAIDQVKRLDDRALTPIYPASPGAATTQATSAKQTATADNAEPLKAPPESAAPHQVAAQPAATATAAPAPRTQATQRAAAPSPAAGAETTGAATSQAAAGAREPVGRASSEPIPAAAPAATPVTTRNANTCNAQACASAYRSFRESDCTYQPFEGPRQLCVSPPAAGPNQASAPRASKAQASTARSRDDDLQNVADEVRRITRDPDVLYPPPSMRDSRRMIVIDRW